jgi:peptidyl-prolyl cis-trans isomerase A (cyclophilin A)
MKKPLLAILLLCAAACGEEPPPPKRTVAPEPKQPMAKASEPSKPQPPPPPPPPPEEKKSAAPAPVPKVLLDPSLPEWLVKAPDEFKVKFSTTKGDFTMLVKKEWSPRGADRFYALVKNGYYDGVCFFRVVAGFMAQLGIHGSPQVSAVWSSNMIQDDPVTQSNKRGMVTFAMRGPNSRTTQIFINYADKNVQLDAMGFSPFGQVVEGMDVVDALYSGYGDGPPRGRGPNQGLMQAQGNEYLKDSFKELDFVKTARILP